MRQTSPVLRRPHGLDCGQIEVAFAEAVGDRYRVQLCGGYAEPWYEPGVDGQHAQLRYTQDFAASALHEIAHWLQAGSGRRAQPDFGLWYVASEARAIDEQKAFERSEANTQALEWCLAQAAGVRFFLSADALANAGVASATGRAGPQYVADAQARLALLVRAALGRRLQIGFTERMGRMLATLQERSGRVFVLSPGTLEQFDQEWLPDAFQLPRTDAVG